MKFYTSIPKNLKPYYQEELLRYSDEFSRGNLSRAWMHLERAHILGQKYPITHTYVHWKMLQFGFRNKNLKEIIGQLTRLIFGGIKSFVGHVPMGNPGGANVSPLKPFPIEKDLLEIFNKVDIRI